MELRALMNDAYCLLAFLSTSLKKNIYKKLRISIDWETIDIVGFGVLARLRLKQNWSIFNFPLINTTARIVKDRSYRSVS